LFTFSHCIGFSFLNYWLQNNSTDKLVVDCNFCAAVILDIEKADATVSGLANIFNLRELSYMKFEPLLLKTTNYIFFQGQQDCYVTPEYTNECLLKYSSFKNISRVHFDNCGHFELVLTTKAAGLIVMREIVKRRHYLTTGEK